MKGDLNMKEIFEVRKKLAVFLNGKKISTYCFDNVKQYRNFIIAYNSNLLKIFNEDGNVILFKKVKVIDFFYDDLLYIIVEKNGLRGVYSCNGDLIVPIKFNNISVYPFAHLIKVSKNHLYGAYSYKGQLLVPADFDEIHPCSKIIEVIKNNLHGAYSYEGRLLIPIEFDAIKSYEEGIKVIKDNLYGAYSYKGILIVPVEFNYIEFYKNAIEVIKGSLHGVYSYKGTLIVPVEFSLIFLNLSKIIAFSLSKVPYQFSYV